MGSPDASGAMKAIRWSAYGAPDVLHVADIPRPVPGDGDILVRIRATTVTAGDCELRGLKFPLALRVLLRLIFGVTRPRRTVLGQELAGEVEGTGAQVRDFQTGDAVFGTTGFGFGAYAEYTACPVDRMGERWPSSPPI